MNSKLTTFLFKGIPEILIVDDVKKSMMSKIKRKSHFIFSFAFILLLAGAFSPEDLIAQTDFAPGEIMFTGYNSDAPNSFSFVLLTNVVSGTVIAITDRGWSNTTGFRVDNTTEGTIELTFTSDFPCGTQIFFNDVGGANDWISPVNESGTVVGTVTILGSGDIDGMELGTTGDQLFIYQNPAPTSGNQANFVTMIHMDAAYQNATTDDNSAKPNGLSTAQVVRFNTEYDNAKYNCNPNNGIGSFMQSVITNDNGMGTLVADNENNWTESDAFLTLTPGCMFCCGSTTTAPVISSATQVVPNQIFTISITGTLAPGASWQLFTAGCGSGSPLQTTMGNNFTVTAPAAPGSITYYVRSSQTLTCPANCASMTVCIDSNPLVLCTDCNANIELCGNCFLQDPFANPVLDSGCYQIKLIFILDESGSIGTPINYEPDVKNGVLAFLTALNGQNIQAAMIEFSDLGRVVNNYEVIDDAYIGHINDYFNGPPGGYNGQNYSPNNGTNWHDAMIKADAMESADLILFFTDGEPTTFTNANGTSTTSCASSNTPTVNAVKLANKLKAEGTHMFMLGLGNNVNALNLERMSGFTQYQSGINTIGTSDYSIGQFSSLASDLQNFVEELCNTQIQLVKEVVGPVCNGIVQFRFIVRNLGTESSTQGVAVTDTFPSGYTNITYTGPAGFKLCPYLQPCSPPLPTNAFNWQIFPIPPLGADTLILNATVLPTGNHDNTAWAATDNADSVHGTFLGTLLTYNQSPTIICPVNVSIQCSASTLPANTGTAQGFDPDGTPPAVTFSDVSVTNACPQNKTITRTWKATDACGSTAMCIQSIVLSDTNPPTAFCPPNVTVDCAANTLPASTGTGTATDACDPSPIMSFSDAIVAGGCPAEFTIRRTWSATDHCGNVGTCLQTIFVDDNTPPSITCKNSTISCSESIDPSNSGFPLVLNNCGGTSTLTYTNNFVFMATAPQCSLLRTWTATDNCGNSSSCIQTITLVDSSPPTVTCPVNVTIACTANTLPGNTGSAIASDNCSVSPAISYTDVITNSPTCSNNYSIARKWKALDECGNSANCTQTITVVDVITPSINCPANLTIACTANTLPANTGTATGSDNCSTAAIVFTDAVVTGACPQELVITRKWRATDACGNSASCNQIITVHDSSPPSMSCPANVTIQCSASTLPATTGLATATDNCSTLAITSTDVVVNGNCPQSKTITRTWKAMDACGNFNTCNQLITVEDSSPPVMSCPVNVTIDCAAITLPANTGSATASDNCSTFDITSTDVITVGPCPQEKIITRTWKATDACTNFSTCIQTITIHDTTAPAMSCPANVTIECTANTLPANTGNSTATDNCSTFAISFTDAIVPGGCPAEKIITRTWKATDACNNFNTCIQIITVDDSTPPVIACAPNVTIECTAVTLPSNTGTSTATDNCSAISITSSDVILSGDCPQEKTIIRTWRATDACGNSSSCNQQITVDDSTPPVITCPGNVTIECTANTLPAANGTATATDNCSTITIAFTDATLPGSCPQESTIARTWKATDACGNFSTCLQTLFIDDSTPPVIICPSNVTVECIGSTLPAQTGIASGSDNCGGTPVITFMDITATGPTLHGYSISRTWKSVDGCGNSSTCNQQITVTNPIDPAITEIGIDTICSGDTKVFQAVDQEIGMATYQWSFGSGASPSTASGIGPHNVTYTYNATNGTTGAWVILTVSLPGCASVTDTVGHIHVNPIPNSAINAATDALCYFRFRNFQASEPQVPGYYYHWDFGQDASLPPQTGYGPFNVKYSTTGPKVVQLIVFANAPGASCGDTSTITFNVITCFGNVTGRVRDTLGVGIQSVNIRLFPDINLDGVPDPGPSSKSVNTTSAGIYSMTSIVPGQYVIVETQPAGYSSKSDIDETNDFDTLMNVNLNDNIIPATIEASEIDADNNFVDKKEAGSSAGYVFIDNNNNLIVDNGEGVPNVTIDLYNDVNHDGIPVPGNIISSKLTSALGFFEFAPLAPGDYILVETDPPGYLLAQDIDISPDPGDFPNMSSTDHNLPMAVSFTENDVDNYFVLSQTCGAVVTNTNDNGPGSLRYAISCGTDGETIEFSPVLQNTTIHLNSGRIEISKNLFIHSSLMPRVRIQSDVPGAFLINPGYTVEIMNIDVISGYSGYPGAAFENLGHLILWDMNVGKNVFLPSNNTLIYNSPAAIMTIKGAIQIDNQ